MELDLKLNLAPTKGKFVDTLKRNNQKIRADRADKIARSAETMYRRYIEDLKMKIVEMVNEQENMLDLSPTHADSLMLASEFNAQKFVNTDVDLAVRIRQATIKLEEAVKRYNVLFDTADSVEFSPVTEEEITE